MTNIGGLPDPEKMSERVLREGGISEPPVDVEQVLGIWKDLDLVHEDLDGSGYLLPLGKLGAEIIVNQKDPIERRRFTIAHELGHWVLGQILKKKMGEFQQPQGVPYAAIEKWCDHFAANILMPRSLVERWLSKRNEQLLIDRILRGCGEFKVSEEAFFIRAWELLKIQVVSLRSAATNRDMKGFEVAHNYGDETSDQLLAELFKIPGIEDHLRTTSPIVFFSGSIPGYRLSCSGRRRTRELLVLSISWEPATALAKHDAGADRTNSRFVK